MPFEAVKVLPMIQGSGVWLKMYLSHAHRCIGDPVMQQPDSETSIQDPWVQLKPHLSELLPAVPEGSSGFISSPWLGALYSSAKSLVSALSTY